MTDKHGPECYYDKDFWVVLTYGFALGFFSGIAVLAFTIALIFS